MLHLSIDRLAALADEQPTADEQSHLDACADCAQEMAAHRSLLAMAGAERDVMGIPLTRWDALSRKLREDGLIAGEMSVTAEFAAPVGKRRPSARAMMRFAAAIMLVVGGAVAGRASTGAPIIPGGLAGDESARSVARGPFSEEEIPTTFASLQEAQRYRELYGAAYRSAVAYLAENDTVGRGTPAVMRARLSALDRVSRTMGEALKDAPYDPVINDFYINSFGQREATLRQLNTVLPQGVRLNGF